MRAFELPLGYFPIGNSSRNTKVEVLMLSFPSKESDWLYLFFSISFSINTLIRSAADSSFILKMLITLKSVLPIPMSAILPLFSLNFLILLTDKTGITYHWTFSSASVLFLFHLKGFNCIDDAKSFAGTAADHNIYYSDNAAPALTALGKITFYLIHSRTTFVC